MEQENNVMENAPQVTLGEYKGLKIKKDLRPVTDEAVEKELQKILEQNCENQEIKGRAVVSGDVATIDFEGFVDNVAFEGGKGEKYDLEIGSGSFIPGFEDQLIGKNVGDEFDIQVNFPEGYGGPDLSGKPAVFKTKIHKISAKSTPELNDEFAQKIANVPTVSQFRAMLRESMEAGAENSAKQKMIDDIVVQIVANSTFDISEDLIQIESQAMLAEYRQQLQGRGVDLEQYLSMMGQTMDQFLLGMKEPAAMRAKSKLAINCIAKVENVTVTEEDMNKEYEQISLMYHVPMEELKTRLREEDLEYIRIISTTNKVFDLLIASAVIE